MKNQDDNFIERLSELRCRAELAAAEKLWGVSDISKLPPEEIQRMIHELQVHQIELEMQNEELREAQIKLEELKDRYLELYDFAPSGYVTVGEAGLILDANLTACRLLGHDRGSLINQPFSRFVFRDDQDNYHLFVRELFETKAAKACDVQLAKKDSKPFYAQLNASVMQDGEGVADFFRISISDITERKRAEEDLLEREAKYRFLAEHASDLLWTLDLNLRTTFVSPSVEKVLGFTPEERMLQNVEDQLTPECLEFVRQRLLEELNIEREQGIEEGKFVLVDLDYLHKNGSVVCLQTAITFIRDENGLPIGLYGISRDITELKRSQEALRESEERYRGVFENAAVGIDLVDTEGRFLQVNESLAIMLGYSQADLLNRTVFDITYPEDVEVSRIHLEQMVQRETHSYRFEKRYIRKDGEVMWADVSVSPVCGPDGVHVATVGVIADITERKRAQEQLKDSESRVRTKLESILLPEGDIGTLELADVIDVAEIQSLMDDFFYLTNFGGAILDLEGNVLVGTGWQDICSKFHREHPQARRNCLESDTLLSVGIEEGDFKLYRCKNNMWDLATPIVVGGKHFGNLFLGQFFFEDEIVDHDIFRSQAHKYGFNEEHYIAALDRVPRWSRETVDRVMRFYAKVIYLISTLTYSNIELARSLADRERLVASLQESKEKYRHLFDNSPVGILSVDTEGRILEVNQMLLEVLGSPSAVATKTINMFELPNLVESGVTEAFQSCLKTGERLLKEIPYVSKWGKQSHLRIVLTPVTDQEGIVTGCQAIVEDITQQEKLEDQLRQAQKMEAVGTLAGGIAHDFNNLLQIISGHAELLDMDLAERKLKFGELDAIRQAAHRGADLVKQILTFSRRINTKFQSINLNEEVRAVERLLYRTIPKMIEIDLRLEQGLDRVRGESTQIEQLLINLSVNANDAMPEGGKLTIETDNAFLDEDYCRSHAELVPGRYVILRVSDTGHGIEQDILQHIFEPFFTTKGLADGTGLGLATVFGIVKMHGGHISCESEVGKGTTFSIYFPAIQEAKPDIQAEQEAAPIAGGTETVLVVDDEPLIANLAKRILGNAGYSVIMAKSGKEALEVYGQHKWDIALVILDLIMPEMGGEQCLKELLKIDPQVKALIASGFAIKGDTKTFLDEEAKGRVAKPFNMRDLLRSVRHVLDGA